MKKVLPVIGVVSVEQSVDSFRGGVAMTTKRDWQVIEDPKVAEFVGNKFKELQASVLRLGQLSDMIKSEMEHAVRLEQTLVGALRDGNYQYELPLRK